jgi:hypothetical protein
MGAVGVWWDVLAVGIGKVCGDGREVNVGRHFGGDWFQDLWREIMVGIGNLCGIRKFDWNVGRATGRDGM